MPSPKPVRDEQIGAAWRDSIIGTKPATIRFVMKMAGTPAWNHLAHLPLRWKPMLPHLENTVFVTIHGHRERFEVEPW